VHERQPLGSEGSEAPEDRAAQRRVAHLVLQGRTTTQIKVDVGISAHTVQDHLNAVFDKVGVRNRRQLVASLMYPAS
jgi:DNA-binding CsgD family transcriptional regulator